MSNEITYKKKVLVFAIAALIWVVFHIAPVAKTFELKFILVTAIGMFIEFMVMIMVIDFILLHRWRKDAS